MMGVAALWGLIFCNVCGFLLHGGERAGCMQSMFVRSCARLDKDCFVNAL